MACISPWNFPLSIFTGQIAGALAAGNARDRQAGGGDAADRRPGGAAVPAEAGVPPGVLQLLPGDGEGRRPRWSPIRRSPASCSPDRPRSARLDQQGSCAKRGRVPLIAETGGQNALIVDSSSLPEQVVTDALTSAFDSARTALLGVARALPAGRYRRPHAADAEGRHGGARRRQSRSPRRPMSGR